MTSGHSNSAFFPGVKSSRSVLGKWRLKSSRRHSVMQLPSPSCPCRPAKNPIDRTVSRDIKDPSSVPPRHYKSSSLHLNLSIYYGSHWRVRDGLEVLFRLNYLTKEFYFQNLSAGVFSCIKIPLQNGKAWQYSHQIRPDNIDYQSAQ